jgi:hypothetical protein
MAKKHPKSEVIKDSNIPPSDAYVTWGEDLASKEAAFKKGGESLDEFTGVNGMERAQAMRRYGLDYSNLDGITGSRPGFTRSDYYYFRPDEAVPQRLKEILKRADDIYQRVGLVKNVIDLMGDFATQGIRIVHKNKRIERFYRRWFKKIEGKDRSERLVNNLYRSGNVVIDRRTAKITMKSSTQLYQSLGTADMSITDIDVDNTQVEKREIPWKYTFIDPIYVEVAAGSLASFVNKKTYVLELPASLSKMINSPKTDEEKTVVAGLPQQIIEAAKSKKAFPLDSEKTIVCHYKKDDWQSWAFPMIYAIMDDITVVEKLKLADMAALDGAISNIRIFKLGNLEHKIIPTKAATSKLAQILGNNVGGGTMDIIWGPDIEMLESNTNVHQFLGEAKYIPHMNNVYAGLGIPPTLTGTFGAAGTTNNFISLKTLTQRLQYGRDVLTRFWENEIILIQKAMGFKHPAKIEFDRMDLSNEDSEKALLIQLADRNLISDELLQTKFGMDPDMEKTRLNRESRERESERMVPKAGPWYDPNPEDGLKKIALQTGIVAPSEIGLELEKKKRGEESALEMKAGLAPASPTPTKLANDSPESLPSGQPGQGRPKLSKDSEKRKTKIFKPQTGASLIIWANKAQDKISEILNPVLLEFYQKKNLRSLSSIESQEVDMVKTKVLLSLDPMSKLDEPTILQAFTKSDSAQYNQIIASYKNWIKNLELEFSEPFSVDDYKQAKASFYSMVYE